MNQNENYNMETESKKKGSRHHKSVIKELLVAVLVIAFLIAIIITIVSVIQVVLYEKKYSVTQEVTNDESKINLNDVALKDAEEVENSRIEVDAPVRLFIKPYYDDYGHIVSLEYSFSYNEKLRETIIAKDNENNTYNVMPVLEYSFNDEKAKIAYSYEMSADYSYLANVFTDSIFYLYEGIEDEQYGNFEQVVKYLSYDDDHGYYFDDSENFVKIRVQFEILDCRTGEISYSDWSDYAYFGKGYENLNEEVTSLKSAPEIKDAYFRYFHLEYAKAVPEIVTMVEATEEAKNLSVNTSGTLYLRFEVKDRSGNFNEIMTGSYNYMDLMGRNDLVFPCDTEEIKVIYDLDNIEIRVRYEWYDLECVPYEEEHEPICVSEWSNFKVSKN